MATRQSTGAAPATRSTASAEGAANSSTNNDTVKGDQGNDTVKGAGGDDTVKGAGDERTEKATAPVNDTNASMLNPDLVKGTTGNGQTVDGDGTVRGAGHVAQFGTHSAMDATTDRPASVEQTARTDGSSLTREARHVVETEFPGAVTVPFGSEPAHIDTGTGKQAVLMGGDGSLP